MPYTYDPNTPQGMNQSVHGFTGSVGSLGYGGLFEGTEFEDDWQQYFDPYDTAGEELATRMSGIDVGQLQSAWDLQSQQLGETWGLTQQQLGESLESQRGQIGTGYRTQAAGLQGSWEEQQAGFGTQAARGFQQADLMGETMQRRGKGLMHGEQRQRMAESEVSGAYKKSFGMGQSAYERAMEGATGQYQQGLAGAQLGYEQQMSRGQLGYGQAMESGEFGLEQGITDIYQGLEQDVFGMRESWQQGQRGTLNVLLGMDIWDGAQQTNRSGSPGGNGRAGSVDQPGQTGNEYSGQTSTIDGVAMKWSSNQGQWIPAEQWDYYAQSQSNWG